MANQPVIKAKERDAITEAVSFAVGAGVGILAAKKLPAMNAWMEALVGAIIVIAGAYVDHDMAGPAIEGFGAVMLIAGLTPEILKVI